MSSTNLPHWQAAKTPAASVLEGRLVRLERLAPAQHGDNLWLALQGPDADPQLWTYMGYGPFAERRAFAQWLERQAASADPQFYSVVARDSGKALGLLSYLNITPAHGSIEIGHICFGRGLQRSALASETLYLLADYAFALGNRRLEWKCDNANQRSRRAAERFGFSYEGLFRQHMVYKGRNRDTAWFSIIDQEWPRCRAAFQQWLDPANFAAAGQQKRRLEELRGVNDSSRDPA